LVLISSMDQWIKNHIPIWLKIVFKRISDAGHSAWDLLPTGWSPGTLRNTRELLDETLPGWNGRGSSAFEWSPRSPDLTTCDNSLWGQIKNEPQKSVIEMLFI
jgi:hypothetical protein